MTLHTALSTVRNLDDFYDTVSEWCDANGFRYDLTISMTRNISHARQQCKFKIAQELTEAAKILENL